MLPRFYEVTNGSVLIDGVNIKDYSLESLRNNIAVVFQDNFLFSGTIRDNILYGKPDATQEQINKVLKMVYLEDFVNGLEKGLDTEIGERGTLLSGGQKQRLAIARALIKDAPIVILDEATSALDNKSEAVVQKALENLMQNKTVFVIAHRLSTLRDADKLAVIDDGECIEFGSYKELMEKQGVYYKMFKLQEEALRFIGVGEETEETDKEDENNESK